MNPDPFPAIRIGFNPCKPTSRGSVRLQSSDPFASPILRGGYLTSDYDRDLMIRGTHEVRRIALRSVLNGVVETELGPGSACHSDAEILDFVRANAWTMFHQCGTCRMGGRMPLNRLSIRSCGCVGSAACASPMPRSSRPFRQATRMPPL